MVLGTSVFLANIPLPNIAMNRIPAARVATPNGVKLKNERGSRLWLRQNVVDDQIGGGGDQGHHAAYQGADRKRHEESFPVEIGLNSPLP